MRPEFVLIGLFVFFVMTGLGTTLSIRDFRQLSRHPLPLLIGGISQFVLMPAIGFGVALLLQFDAMLALSTVLLAACPGEIGIHAQWLEPWTDHSPSPLR